MIEKELGPQLIGQDCRTISKHWENLYSGVRGHYALERGHVFPILGRRGITISAISGIDIALWDILGQSLYARVAIARWEKARKNASLCIWLVSADHIGDQLLSYIDKGGFKAVKCGLSCRRRSPTFCKTSASLPESFRR